MSMLPAGKYALIKVDEKDGVERFVILFVDPQHAERDSYLWTNSDALDEQGAAKHLREMGVDEQRIAPLLKAARDQFVAQHGG